MRGEYDADGSCGPTDAAGAALRVRRVGEALEVVQPQREVRSRLVHGEGAGLVELGLAVAAREHADAADARARCCPHVVRRVTHEYRGCRAGHLECDCHDVGSRLRPRHIVAGRGLIAQARRIEELEVVLEMLGRRGAREDDAPALVMSPADQLGGARQRPHLAHQGLVLLLPCAAQRLTALALHLLAQQRRHELVAAHPDEAMDAICRDLEAVRAASALPGEGVQISGVDERAVDVEKKSRAQYHLPRANPPNAMRPTSATITPIQTLQMMAMMIPTITRIPPRPMPVLLPPERCTDTCNSFLFR